MDDTTVIEFDHDGEIWPILEAWAEDAGYSMTGDGEFRRLVRGTGALSSARMLTVVHEHGRLRIEAWVQSWPFVKLIGVPEMMGIESGGLQAVFPRWRARADVNRLLERLGGPQVS
jgi:hypothetical protein